MARGHRLLVRLANSLSIEAAQSSHARPAAAASAILPTADQGVSVSPACQLANVRWASTSSLASGGRFYKTVNIKPAQQGGYQVFLDQRAIKTPGKHPLIVPSEALALALAAEWEWQEKNKPLLHTMPLMSIAATALDQPKPRDKVIETLLKYIHTDTACCRYEEGKLSDRQAQMYDPLLAWAGEALGWQLEASDSIFGPTQSDETMTKVRSYLEGLDHWHLAAVEQLTSVCKSLLIAVAVNEGRLGVKEALEAARLEENFQMEDWGMVEAGHDVDEADVSTRIAAPSLFVRLMALGRR